MSHAHTITKSCGLFVFLSKLNKQSVLGIDHRNFRPAFHHEQCDQFLKRFTPCERAFGAIINSLYSCCWCYEGSTRHWFRRIFMYRNRSTVVCWYICRHIYQPRMSFYRFLHIYQKRFCFHPIINMLLRELRFQLLHIYQNTYIYISTPLYHEHWAKISRMIRCEYDCDTPTISVEYVYSQRDDHCFRNIASFAISHRRRGQYPVSGWIHVPYYHFHNKTMAMTRVS